MPATATAAPPSQYLQAPSDARVAQVLQMLQGDAPQPAAAQQGSGAAAATPEAPAANPPAAAPAHVLLSGLPKTAQPAAPSGAAGAMNFGALAKAMPGWNASGTQGAPVTAPPGEAMPTDFHRLVSKAFAPNAFPAADNGQNPFAQAVAELRNAPTPPELQPETYKEPSLVHRLLYGLSAAAAGWRRPEVGAQMVERYNNAIDQREQQEAAYNAKLPMENYNAQVEAAKQAAYQREIDSEIADHNSAISGRLAQQAIAAHRWTPVPSLGVEVNPQGETRPLTVNGQPVAVASTPERDKQRMLQLEQALTNGTISASDRATLVQLQRDAKVTGLKPEIVAQVGQPPVPADFPRGNADPAYKSAASAWGQNYEKVENVEAEVSGAARGEGFNQSRPMAVIDENGNFRIMSAADAERRGLAPATQGQKVMAATAIYNDMIGDNGAVPKLRKAIEASGNSTWSPTVVAKLKLAMANPDAGMMTDQIANLMASGLTPAQQDVLTWLQQLQERALTLRSVSGMGQGSETTRGAILAALPSIVSGNQTLALKKLDAFQNMVENLAKGVGHAAGVAPIGAVASPGAPAPAVPTTGETRSFHGASYKFDGKQWVKQ